MDKENRHPQDSPTRLTPRKSYSILSPAAVNRTNPQTHAIAKTPKKDRVFSESTGLVKFSLSPPKSKESPKKLLFQTLPAYIPSVIEEEVILDPRQQFETRQHLLAQYASKQAILEQLQKQTEAVKKDLLDISINLRKYEDDPFDTPYKATVNTLRKKASDIFQPSSTDQMATIRKKASSIFQASERPNFEEQIHTLSKKASSLFVGPSRPENVAVGFKGLVSDMKSKMDKNHTDFDDLTNKTSKMVTDFWTNLSSPKRSPPEKVVDSSFNFENIAQKDDDINTSHILVSDELQIDIDDYSSDEE